MIGSRAIRRARREAHARDARIRFVEATLRALHKTTRDTFDVVICCDNSLAHMMRPRESGAEHSGAHKVIGIFHSLDSGVRRADQEASHLHSGRTLSWSSGRTHCASATELAAWRTYDQHLFILRRLGDLWSLRHYSGGRAGSCATSSPDCQASC